MATSLPFGVPIPQDSRSSAQHEQEARSPPVDERLLQLLDNHRPWELLDDTVLAIIDQTYATLLEIVGLAAAPPQPEGGGSVKVTELVYTAATGPDSPPVPCVVVASARHCLISLITGFDNGDWYEYSKFTSQLMQKRPPPPAAGAPRASVDCWPGTIRLVRTAGDVRPDVTAKGFLAELDIRRGFSGAKGLLLGVLGTVRSRLNTAIQAESGMIRAAMKSGCRSPDKLRDIFTVRTVLDKMRREVDISVIMRKRTYERHRRAREIVQRLPVAEMDVDQVDEEEVLAKRLKAMHV